jgi:hypothetical protein
MFFATICRKVDNLHTTNGRYDRDPYKKNVFREGNSPSVHPLKDECLMKVWAEQVLSMEFLTYRTGQRNLRTN